MVAFVAVAIAKPWSGTPSRPAASASPPAVAPASNWAAGSSPGSPAAIGGTPDPRAEKITLPVPPPTDAAWTRIDWRQLAPDEALNLIHSVVPWRGGFVALGFDSTDPIAPTPLWTSTDGATWQVVPAGTAATFWSGVQVVAIAATPTGLAALTSPGAECDGYALCEWFGPPVTSWISSDGRHWVPRSAPALGTAVTWRGAALAAGPAGLVAVSMGTHAEVASSADGVAWIASPAGILPTEVAVGILQGTPTGYVLAGTTAPRGSGDGAGPANGSRDPGGPGTLWSADGREWQPGSAAPGGGGPDGAVSTARSSTARPCERWRPVATAWSPESSRPMIRPSSAGGAAPRGGRGSRSPGSRRSTPPRSGR